MHMVLCLYFTRGDGGLGLLLLWLNTRFGSGCCDAQYTITQRDRKQETGSKQQTSLPPSAWILSTHLLEYTAYRPRSECFSLLAQGPSVRTHQLRVVYGKNQPGPVPTTVVIRAMRAMRACCFILWWLTCLLAELGSGLRSVS